MKNLDLDDDIEECESTTIITGVTYVTCPSMIEEDGHGILSIDNRLARKILSKSALQLGDTFNDNYYTYRGSLFFIPMFENEKLFEAWKNKMNVTNDFDPMEIVSKIDGYKF